jgi:lipoate synthase
MARQRITDARRRLLGYIEEANSERKLVLLDAARRRLGAFSPDTGIMVGLGNTLLDYFRTMQGRSELSRKRMGDR